MKVSEDIGPILSKSKSDAPITPSGSSIRTSCSTSEPPLVMAYMLPLTHERRHGGTYGGSTGCRLAVSRSISRRERMMSSCCLETSNAARATRLRSEASSACCSKADTCLFTRSMSSRRFESSSFALRCSATQPMIVTKSVNANPANSIPCSAIQPDIFDSSPIPVGPHVPDAGRCTHQFRRGSGGSASPAARHYTIKEVA